MPTTEINAHLKYRNTSGDTTVIYPITRADNIEGILPITSGGTGASTVATARANLGAAPVFTYGTEDIVSGSTSEEPDGTIHFVYTTKDGIWDYVKAMFISVDGVWRLICDTSAVGSSDYTITYELAGVTGAASNPTTLAKNGTATLTFAAESGYELPDSVTVSGAAYTWDKNTGVMTLSNPTGNITVAVAAAAYTISYYLAGVTGADTNPTMLAKDGAATLIFTAESGYELPDEVIVTGAEYTWNKSTGVMTLSNPTGNITVVVAAAYTITYNLTGVTGAASNPTILAKNGTATLTFTAESGYELPDEVTVDGATYTWNKNTGVMTLINPTGNITVTVAAAYTITYYLTGVTGAAINPTILAKNGSATLLFIAESGYELPDEVIVSGATYTWNKSTGVMTLSNPTGNITVVVAAAYTITYNLTGVTGASSNPTTIAKNGTATLTFTANEGYTLPDSVTVTGAEYTWNKSTGKLTLSNPTGNVVIVIGSGDYTITYYLSGVTGAASNSTTIAKNGSATLTFTANTGYTMPDTVIVDGATSNWAKSDDGYVGALTLSNPTGNVSVVITGVAAYTITANLTGVTGATSNPTTITKNGTAMLTFTANTGYTLPDSVTVSGATSSWNKNTGVLTLSNPTGNITVTIVGVATKTTYTTTINVDDVKYWTTPTATENASPELTITVGKYTSGKLYFSYSYQGSQVGTYAASSTDIIAFKYNGTQYTSGQSFTIGGDTGQDTVANIYTVETTGTTTYTTSINYYLDGSLATTKTVTSTSGYLTATAASKNNKTATVTLSDSSTNSYTYSSSLSSVSYTNASDGVINVYATALYTTSINYYLGDTLVTTKSVTSISGYLTATAVSKDGNTATVTLSDTDTNSYTYDATLTGVSYENTSSGVISVYATATYTTSINYYLDGNLVGTHTVSSTSGYLTATYIEGEGKASATVLLSNNNTDIFVYSQLITTLDYENTSSGVINVYAVSKSATQTYTTTINVDGANYWTSPTATENASPQMTIAVGKMASGKLYFTYSYQGSQIGMYTADSTDITAFKYNGTEYTRGQSFTIGGETGQNTIANIYTVKSYSTSIKYYLDGTVVTTKTVSSTSGYLTATKASNSGATATVTLSDGSTNSYTYSSTLDSVSFSNTSSGVINVYAKSKTYTTSIKYYLDGALAKTNTATSTYGYYKAANASLTGDKTATVMMYDDDTEYDDTEYTYDSYTYSSTLDSVTYENTSSGIISVYATT